MAKLTEEQVKQVVEIIQSTPAPLVPKTVREYIGARYVPVFANPLEWSDTREYEPLTIVTYQGNSYTSMQYVPTGIEIANTSFWALTGNYNAQIEAYRQEVQAFDGRITQNTEDIKQLKARSFGFIGDSFSDPTAGYDWVGTLLPKFLGAPVYNEAYSGAGFIGSTSAQDHTFLKQLESLYANHPDLTDIILYGGNNDLSKINSSELTNAIHTFTEQVNHLFPTVKCHFFIANFNTNKQEDVTTYGATIEFGFVGITNPTVKYSIYNMADKWMFDMNLFKSATDSHPSDAGRQYIAMFIASIVNGADMSSTYEHRITPANGVNGLNISSLEFSGGCILGTQLEFKLNVPQARNDVFTWETPLNFVKPFTCIGVAGQNIPCLCYVGTTKATLYFDPSDVAKISNDTLIIIQLPTISWQSTIGG